MHLLLFVSHNVSRTLLRREICYISYGNFLILKHLDAYFSFILGRKRNAVRAGYLFLKRFETNYRNHRANKCINHVYPVQKAVASNSILVLREINYEYVYKPQGLLYTEV